MNENIDLTKILEDCQEGTKLYSAAHGEVSLICRDDGITYPIIVRLSNKTEERFTAYGKLYNTLDGECILFPSREERSWSKFAATLRKKERFDPKTLKPFDKVLVRDFSDDWNCEFFSHVIFSDVSNQYATIGNYYQYCIPYDENTKHLVGTNEEAPEFYRYWED